MTHPPPHIYEFSHFRLDVAERHLLRDGALVPLQPKVFDLLQVLVEHHGHLLSKEELLAELWRDTTVEETNLSNNISTLRRVLGDHDQQFIETQPKRGYRFVAPVFAAIGSLAVLPIKPLQPNEDDAYLGLGIADVVITRLSATGKLAVRPTSAIRKYAADDCDPVAVGRALQVDDVLESSFWRAKEKVRVTTRLLCVATEAPLWSFQCEELFTDEFAAQNRIAERITEALLAYLAHAVNGNHT
jgi:DNA-binding winged helix-turn-helix (wHTH) protein